MTEKKFEENIRFVARHYRRGAFDMRGDWIRLALANSASPTHWRKVAAIAAGVVLTASACVFTWLAPRFETQSPAEPEATETVLPDRLKRIEKIEFTDASLTEVIEATEKVYGVRITNVPDGDYRLTLSYEGNAVDLVETINELLGINLEIEQ